MASYRQVYDFPLLYFYLKAVRLVRPPTLRLLLCTSCNTNNCTCVRTVRSPTLRLLL